LEFYGRHCHVHKKNNRKAPAPKTLEIPEEPEIPAIWIDIAKLVCNVETEMIVRGRGTWSP